MIYELAIPIVSQRWSNSAKQMVTIGGTFNLADVQEERCGRVAELKEALKWLARFRETLEALQCENDLAHAELILRAVVEKDDVKC